MVMVVAAAVAELLEKTLLLLANGDGDARDVDEWKGPCSLLLAGPDLFPACLCASTAEKPEEKSGASPSSGNSSMSSRRRCSMRLWCGGWGAARGRATLVKADPAWYAGG